MSDREKRNEGDRRPSRWPGGTRPSMWVYLGVGILILLLIVWLTIADFWGDTDVAAMAAPLL